MSQQKLADKCGGSTEKHKNTGKARGKKNGVQEKLSSYFPFIAPILHEFFYQDI
jgi:hypothetical protein